MKEQGYKKITINVPDEIIRKAGHILKIRSIDLKDYILDLLKKSVTVIDKSHLSNDSIWKITNLGKSNNKDISEKHDKYIYGSKAK